MQVEESAPTAPIPEERRVEQRREGGDGAINAAEARQEAEAQKKRSESEAQQREVKKEAEELERERAEAELRARQSTTTPAETENKKKEADEVVQALVALRKRYIELDPNGLATCLKTLRAYVNNLAKNPQEVKYQRINCENNAFRTRIAAFDGAVAVLTAIGFQQQEDGALAVNADFVRTKGFHLSNVLTKVDIMIGNLPTV